MGGTIKGGTIATTDGASLLVSPLSGAQTNSGTLDGVTLRSDLVLPAKASLTVKNGLVLENAKLTLASGTAGNSIIWFNGTQTLSGTGEVIFAGAPTPPYDNRLWTQSNGTQAGATILTLGAGITVHGGQGGDISTQYSFDRIINKGTISPDTAGKQIIIPRNWTNEGLFKPLNGGSLVLYGDYTLATLGSFDATGGTISLNGTLDNTGTILALDAATGPLTVGGTIKGGTIRWTGGVSPVLQGGTFDGVTLASDLTLPRFARLNVKNGLTLSNNAKITLFGGNPGGSETMLIFDSGVQTLGGTGEVIFAGTNAFNAITAQGNGTAATAATLTIDTGITVHGSQGGTIFTGWSFDSIINKGTITEATPGISIDIVGNVTNEGTVAADAGSVSWSNASPNAGTIRVGPGGLVSVSGSFTNTNAGIVLVKIGGTTSSQFGRLAVSGAITLGGTLNLAAVNGFSPTIGDVFQVMTFGSLTGEFTAINGLAIGNGNVFSPVYTSTSLTFNVIAAGGAAGGAALRFNTPVDTDGDGASDEQELAAGTDPQNAASVFRITAIKTTTAGVELIFETVSGKTYQLEFAPDPSDSSWRLVGDPISGTGKSLQLMAPLPMSGGRGFYRISVTDSARD